MKRKFFRIFSPILFLLFFFFYRIREFLFFPSFYVSVTRARLLNRVPQIKHENNRPKFCYCYFYRRKAIFVLQNCDTRDQSKLWIHEYSLFSIVAVRSCLFRLFNRNTIIQSRSCSLFFFAFSMFFWFQF